MIIYLTTVIATRYPQNIELSDTYKIVTPVNDINLHLRSEKLGDDICLYMSKDQKKDDRVSFAKKLNHTGYKLFVNDHQICYDVYTDKTVSCKHDNEQIWDIEEYKGNVTICTTFPKHLSNFSYNYEFCLTISDRQNDYGDFPVGLEYARKYYVNQTFNIYETNELHKVGDDY